MRSSSTLCLAFLAVVGTSAAAWCAQPNVQEVANFSAFYSLGTPSPFPAYLMIDDYATSGDGGGGYFVNQLSGSCTDDGGITLVESSHCFIRRFTGAVHLKWYGVTNSTSDASTQLQNAIKAAQNYVGANGCVDLDGLRVKIGSSGNNFGAIVVPANVILGCDDAPFGGRNTTSDFTTMPNTLLLWEDPTTLVRNPYTTTSALISATATTIPVVTTTSYPPSGYLQIENEIIHYDSKDSTNFYITTSPGRGALGTVAMQHLSLAVLRDVPQNWTIQLQAQGGIKNDNIMPQTWTAAPTNTLRYFLDNVSGQFYGGALRCTGDGCQISNMYILGFDTGVEAVGAPRLYMDHLTVDANTCFQLHGVNGETQGGNLRCYPLLTSGLSNANWQWQITQAANDSGAIKLTVSGGSSTADNWFENGDTVWVSNVERPQGANGRWIVGNASINTGTGTATFDLVGSSWAGPSVSGVSWTNNSPIMTLPSATSFTNIYGQQQLGSPSSLYPGQFICDHGSAPSCTPPTGIPNGTFVVSVWPTKNEIVMSQSATANVGSATVEFLNDNTTTGFITGCSGSTVSGSCVSAYSSQRFWTYNQATTGPWTAADYTGQPSCTLPTPPVPPSTPLSPGTCFADGFLIGGHDTSQDDNHGVTFNNMFSYAHQVQFHLWNTNSTGLFGIGSDNHSELNDTNVIGLHFDGNTDRTKVDLRETHSNFIDILQNSSTADCNTVVAGEMDVDVANAHDFENDKGCLILSHANNDNIGVALVANTSDQTELSLNYMPSVTLYYEGNVASQTTLGDGSNEFANGSASNLANFGSCLPLTSRIVVAQFCGSDAPASGTGNTVLQCNPAYASGTSGCMRWQLAGNGKFQLRSGVVLPQNGNFANVLEYDPTLNALLEPDNDAITSVAHGSVSDLTADINVVTTWSGANTGVQLPLTTAATDLVTIPVTGAASNGSGLIRLSFGSTAGFATNGSITVKGVNGTTEANTSTSNPFWKGTLIDSTHIDLQSSSFAHTYTSGGVASWSVTPGVGSCKKVVNSTASSITVWAHSSESITIGGAAPAIGSTGMPLAAYTTAVFCPVLNVGWVGN